MRHTPRSFIEIETKKRPSNEPHISEDGDDDRNVYIISRSDEQDENKLEPIKEILFHPPLKYDISEE